MENYKVRIELTKSSKTNKGYSFKYDENVLEVEHFNVEFYKDGTDIETIISKLDLTQIKELHIAIR